MNMCLMMVECLTLQSELALYQSDFDDTSIVVLQRSLFAQGNVRYLMEGETYEVEVSAQSVVLLRSFTYIRS